jgi:hypothetical protein
MSIAVAYVHVRSCCIIFVDCRLNPLRKRWKRDDKEWLTSATPINLLPVRLVLVFFISTHSAYSLEISPLFSRIHIFSVPSPSRRLCPGKSLALYRTTIAEFVIRKLRTQPEVLNKFVTGLLERSRILGRNWDKSLKSFHPCYSQSPLLTDFTAPPPPPLRKKWLETGL